MSAPAFDKYDKYARPASERRQWVVCQDNVVGGRAFFAGYDATVSGFTRWDSDLDRADWFAAKAAAQDVVRGLNPDRNVRVLTVARAREEGK